jgi:thiaminase/transcriptional activator TenA
VGEVAAVILPCAWGYCEIGQRLYAQGLPENQPLYAQWIETYNSPEFEALAAWLREFIDRCATGAAQAELDAMERAFMLSSQYEYMFWDAAWRMEEWPV